MAADLASTPSSGIRVQCCGDAHLCNFGGFATPERKVIFSINDLDETLPAPWEWDVKRLAASFVVASRDNGLKDATARDVATTCVRTYRESMAEFSRMKTLELWYQALGADELVAGIKDPEFRERAIKRLQKERAKSVAEDIFPKLVEHKGEMPVIKDQLPTIFHDVDSPPGEIHKAVLDALAGYRDTLQPAYQSVLDRFELRDAAIKVVGIGSVGTACWVFLFMAGEGDPLFLQVKEARASVLEPYAGATVFPNHGQRVVHGYRLMQPASDMFLGWSRGPGGATSSSASCGTSRSASAWRASGPPRWTSTPRGAEGPSPSSHARSGNSATLSGYMGKSDVFDKAIAAFGVAYADQNEKDHDALERAVRRGKVKAVFEEVK